MKKLVLSQVATALLLSASLQAGGVEVKSKAGVLKFSGVHYLGFVHKDPEVGDSDDKFETRRNYFQVKAYFNDMPKNYLRVTVDTHNEDGASYVWLKYAYLYLDSVLPNTGVEIGQVHRPWIDYEEHHNWLYRSIAKTFVEEHNGAHFTNSADKGINFKTKTDSFSSEIGLFNGEGYHGSDKDGENGLSFEWRLTASLLGTGKKHVHASKDTYADLSFMGQYNTKHLKNDEDFVWYGINAVYNQPQFLIGATYLTADDKGEANNGKTGSGYSVNGEYRLDDRWAFLGRYDYFEDDNNKERKETIAGMAYKYSKNVKFIANIFNIEDKEDKAMLTAEVKW